MNMFCGIGSDVVGCTNFIVMDGRGVVCREFESSKLVHVSEVKIRGVQRGTRFPCFAQPRNVRC
jgi:hypothetical protein